MNTNETYILCILLQKTENVGIEVKKDVLNNMEMEKMRKTVAQKNIEHFHKNVTKCVVFGKNLLGYMEKIWYNFNNYN